jgi:hypothetical protein
MKECCSRAVHIDGNIWEEGMAFTFFCRPLVPFGVWGEAFGRHNTHFAEKINAALGSVCINRSDSSICNMK